MSTFTIVIDFFSTYLMWIITSIVCCIASAIKWYKNTNPLSNFWKYTFFVVLVVTVASNIYFFDQVKDNHTDTNSENFPGTYNRIK